MLRRPLVGPRAAATLVVASLSFTMNFTPAVPATCTTGGPFAPPVSISLNGKPNRLVLRDFNSDGIPDIATSVIDAPNGGPGNKVAVLLGDGAGGYGLPNYLTVGESPAAVCAAFLDGDSVVDLAVSNSGSNTISILHGVGDGSFLSLGVVHCGQRPYELAAADLNEDGTTDLVVALNRQFDIQVLLGTGAGSFAAPVAYSLPRPGLGIAVGRINGDEHVDVVATADTHGCILFLGNGDGTLGIGHSIITGPLAYTLALADVDADGDLDLAVANSSFGGAAIVRGNGLGGFTPPTFYAQGANVCGIAFGDFDRDGIPDFAATSASDNSVRLLRGVGAGGIPTGGFQPVNTIWAGTIFPVGIAAGQCNGDTFTDLVLTGYESRALVSLLGLCDVSTPAFASLVSALADPDRVRIEWSVDASGPVTVERATETDAWLTAGAAMADGSGRVRWEDTSVEPGRRYGYRLALGAGGGEPFAGEAWVEVPIEARLAIAGLTPNPGGPNASIVFSLGSSERSTIEMVDLAGRRVFSREVGAMGPGTHSLSLGGRMAPGVYWLRLTQGEHSVKARGVIIQ